MEIRRSVAMSDVPASSSFRGSGPGVQARDGCSVELYRRLPYADELDFLVGMLAPGASILELGCGAGRQSRALLSLGYTVTAVDNCADMLAHAPPQTRRVHGDIEQLQLREKFDVVLLASGLINHADAALRTALLRAAALHVQPGGRFIFERQDALWLSTAEAGWCAQQSGVSVTLEAVQRNGAQVELRLRYGCDNASWTHACTLTALDDAALQAMLDAAGFAQITWLDAAQRWAAVSLKNAD